MYRKPRYGMMVIILVVHVKSTDPKLGYKNLLESLNSARFALNCKRYESLAHNEDLDDVDLTAIGEEVLAEGTVDATTGGVQVKYPSHYCQSQLARVYVAYLLYFLYSELFCT